MDVEVNEKQHESLRKAGMSNKRKLKESDDGLTYLTFRRPVTSRQGKELPPVAVVGKDLKPIDSLVGNGSVAKVKVDLIPYDNKFGKGVMTRLVALQVLELKEYSKGRGAMEGFEVEGEAADSVAGLGDDGDFI